MSTLIKCPVEIKSSGGRQGIDYSSINHVHIKEYGCFENVKMFGLNIAGMNITPKNELTFDKETITTKLDLCFRTVEDMSSEESIRFALNIEKHITFLLAESDENPMNGFSYAEMDWVNFRATKIDSLLLETHCRPSIYVLSTMIKSLIFKEKQWNVANEYNDVIFDSYYNGIKANHYTSKYFHWFLIIEAIEHSELYKREFREYLFHSGELDAIAEQFKDNEIKRNAITGLKNRTIKSRKEKLYEILQKMGITSYRFHNKDHALSLDIIDKMIKFRNSLFHRGDKLDELFVWNNFFPIIRDVVRLLSEYPTLLD